VFFLGVHVLGRYDRGMWFSQAAHLFVIKMPATESVFPIYGCHIRRAIHLIVAHACQVAVLARPFQVLARHLQFACPSFGRSARSLAAASAAC
jgi:hypothetical protein